MGLTVLYDLTWRDIICVLVQTLTPNSNIEFWGKAVAYGDKWLGNESAEKGEGKTATFSTGNQMVPTRVQSQTGIITWLKKDGDQSPFVRCVLVRTQVGAR